MKDVIDIQDNAAGEMTSSSRRDPRAANEPPERKTKMKVSMNM